MMNNPLKVGHDISQQDSNIGSKASKSAYHKINNFRIQIVIQQTISLFDKNIWTRSFLIKIHFQL